MDYEIITKDGKSKMIFLTKAKNIKGALRHLLNNSHDFKMVKNEKSIIIKIKRSEK